MQIRGRAIGLTLLAKLNVKASTSRLMTQNTDKQSVFVSGFHASKVTGSRGQTKHASTQKSKLDF